MPKTTKTHGGGKRFPLNMRTTEATRDKLAMAAEHSGRSLAQEVEYRLEWSFNAAKHFEDALGGPDVRNKIMLMASAFKHHGTTTAHSLGHPEWTPSEWVNDPQCYRAALGGVIEALLKASPDGAWDEEKIFVEFEYIKRKFVMWWQMRTDPHHGWVTKGGSDG